MQKNLRFFVYSVSIVAISILPLFSYAQTVGPTLQQSIDQKNAEIQALQQQINQYQDQVDQFSTQAQTLQGALNGINQNQSQLKRNINLTTTKISRTNLVIQQNQNQIGTLGQGIVKSTTALNETIRALNSNDQQSFLNFLASDQTISQFLLDVDQIVQVQRDLKDHVITLRDAKTNLEFAQQALQQKKIELQGLNSQLSDQKKVVDEQAQEKATLLATTKNQESKYQALIAATQKQVEDLNSEIYNYESQLKFTLNPNSLPVQGALAWPLSSVLITQKFGKTVDAKRLYVSGSHSGVDFRASIGTPVYAAADGVVEGTGDTDLTCYKASFGKWVFIKHNNGLSTVYGHLSVIKATEGETVKQGDLIGYSGATGHVTGPHLHVTVFATNGVNGEEGARVAERPSINSACRGKVYRMPLAPTSAYLDPLLYFPKASASMFKNANQTALD